MGKENSSSPSQTDLIHRLSRRSFLLGALALTQTPDIRAHEEHPYMETVRFAPSQLGLSLQPRAIRWYGLDEDKAIDHILSLPYDHVRIAFPMDHIWTAKDTFNFSYYDRLLEKALSHGKTVHAQFGVKTFGYPEVNIAQWMFEQFPFLKNPSITIGEDKDTEGFFLEGLTKIVSHYLSRKEFHTIHVENEGFSKRFKGALYRSISPSFYLQEIKLIQQVDSHKRQIVQNLPLDTPEAARFVLNHSDIVGLNIYNQTDESFVPEWALRLLPARDTLFWAYIRSVFAGLRLVKPNEQIWVTEAQSAPWLAWDKTPAYPFSQEKFERLLSELKQLNPHILFLWDVEQALWKKMRYENSKNWNRLETLAE